MFSLSRKIKIKINRTSKHIYFSVTFTTKYIIPF